MGANPRACTRGGPLRPDLCRRDVMKSMTYGLQFQKGFKKGGFWGEIANLAPPLGGAWLKSRASNDAQKFAKQCGEKKNFVN